MRLEPCPQCGGILKYNPEKSVIYCPECKQEYSCAGGCCSEKKECKEQKPSTDS